MPQNVPPVLDRPGLPGPRPGALPWTVVIVIIVLTLVDWTPEQILSLLLALGVAPALKAVTSARESTP
ncbi:hypothetical protein ACBR40_45785 [Nonomuraea sp. AD125B]|uniref:hypothetical protein n=1 Tax=Nonomuraea sp. AD125B TaxID=3242897 RepID=UPI003529322E